MDRHFTEQQVSDIIKRAADHQLRDRVSSKDNVEGVSETDLRSVALELGVGAEALDKALKDIGSVTADDSGTIQSFRRTLVRTFDREISDEDLAVVMEEFPPIAGSGGSSFTIGKTIQYHSVFGVSPCNVTISRRRGKTEIKVKADIGLGVLPYAGASFMSIIFILIGLFEYGGDNPLMALVMAALVPISLYGVAFWNSRAIFRKINKRVLDALDKTTAKLLELND